MRRSSRLLLVSMALLAAACDRQMLGLPRIALSATSPDQRAVAYVRNHPTIDGPSQSVWLAADGHADRELRRLGEDSDWCDTIVWSADGSTVAWLIQDARLITADRRSRQIVSEEWLVDHQDYPSARMVWDLSLSPDGRQARFRDCPRPGGGRGRMGDCGERIVAIR